MDFLRDVKARLEELEQMAKEMENQQKPGSSSTAKSFQPKQQSGRGGLTKAEKAGQAKANQQKNRQPQQKKGQQPKQQQKQQQGRPQQQQNVRSSRQPVDGAECPVEEWVERHPNAQGKLPQGSFILDNLQQYVGEAFLIQEILGPPMCMRDFD